MCLFEARTHFLPAALTGLGEPLRAIRIGDKHSNCFFAEGAVARLNGSWQDEFFFLDSPYHLTESRRREISFLFDARLELESRFDGGIPP